MNPEGKDKLEDVVPGYPRLASLMSLRPGTMILRRFHALNARNLLYMQAELCALEKQLLTVEKGDAANKTGQAHLYSRDFEWLQNSSEKQDHSQIDLILTIRARLKDYSK